MATRKQKYKEILLLDFITCKDLNCKALRTKLFEGGYYVMAQGGAYMVLNVYVMIPRETYMGLNVCVMK